MSEAADLLRSGDLAGLRALFAGRVRAEPAVAGHRLDLAELLLVQGDLERADAQLDLVSQQDTSLALPVALTRQLIRAATARAECFGSRRPPQLVADVDEGGTAALARLAGLPAAPAGKPLTGEVDGRPFDDLRDADDRTAEILEVLTSTGRYVWVSFAQIARLAIRPPERLRDLVWRQAELEVRGGPTGVVYLPAIYPSPATDAQRLGRETQWVDAGDQVHGLGLRTFLVGEDALALGEFTELMVAA